MLLIRLGFVVYWVFLTVMLLLPDPEKTTGVGPLPPPLDEHFVHFSLLAALAVLAHASRWPVAGRTVIAALLLYAAAIEPLQTLSPPRNVELKDLVENVLGIAAGSALWWVALKTRLIDRVRKPACPPPSSTNPKRKRGS